MKLETLEAMLRRHNLTLSDIPQLLIEEVETYEWEPIELLLSDIAKAKHIQNMLPLYWSLKPSEQAGIRNGVKR